MVSGDVSEASTLVLSSSSSVIHDVSVQLSLEHRTRFSDQSSREPGGWDSNGTFWPAVAQTTSPSSDGKPLAQEGSRTNLSLSNRSLTAVSLEGLPNELTSLSLAANCISSISLDPLVTASQLTALILNSNLMTSLDLSPLSYALKLERLWLHNNRLTQLDLSPLAECKGLRSLYLDSNKIDNVELDLSPLASCKLLRALRLGKNNLAGNLDITPILGCSALSTLDVSASVKLTARVVPIAEAGSLQAAAGALPPALRRRAATVHWIAEEQPDTCTSSISRPSLDCTVPESTPFQSQSPNRHISQSESNLKESDSLEELAELCNNLQASNSLLALMVGFRRSSRFASQMLLEEHGGLRTAVVASLHNSSARAIASTGALNACSVILVRPEAQDLITNLRALDCRIPIVAVGSSHMSQDAQSDCMHNGATTVLQEPLDQRDAIAVHGLAQRRRHESRHGLVASSVGSTLVVSESQQQVDECDANLGSVPSKDPRHAVDAPCKAARGAQWNFSSGSEISPAEQDLFVGCAPIHHASTIRHGEICDAASGPCTSVRPSKPQTPQVLHSGSSVDNKRCRAPVLDLSLLRERKPGKASARSNRIEESAISMLFARCGGRAYPQDFSAIATLCGLPVCAASLLHLAAKVWASALSKEDLEVSPAVSPISVIAFSPSCEPVSATRTAGNSGRAQCSSNNLWNSASPSASHRDDFSESKSFAREFEAGRSHGSRRSLEELMEFVEDHKREGDGVTCEMFKKFWLAHMRDQDAETRLYNVLRVAHRSENGAPASALYEIAAALVVNRVCDMDSHQVRLVAGSILCYEIKGSCWEYARRQELSRCKLCAVLLAAESGVYEGVATQLRSDRISDIRMAFAAASGKRVGGGRTRTLREITWLNSERGLLSPKAVEALFSRKLPNQWMDIAQFAPMWLAISDTSTRSSCEYLFDILDVGGDGYVGVLDVAHFYSSKCSYLEQDGFVPASLDSVWFCLRDSFKGAGCADPPNNEQLSLMEIRRAGSRDWTTLFQTLLFVDDELSMVDIRRTAENGSPSARAAVALS